MEARVLQAGEWSLVIDALHALTNMMTVRSHYSEGHPAIARADTHAAKAFGTVLEAVPQLLVAFVDGEFVISERPMPELRDRLHVLASAMTRHEIECIVCHRGMTRNECEVLAKTLTLPADIPGRVREHAQKGLVHVLLRFLETKPDGVTKKSAGVESASLVPLVRDLLGDVVLAIDAEEEIDRAAVQSLAAKIVSVCAHRSFAIEHRALVDGRDDDAVRATNVALMTAAMALEARYPDAVRIDVTAAALLHDIGRMLLPRAIRGVPEPLLSGAEQAIFRTHTTEGALALLAGGCPDLWVATALEHHRGIDGKGYPVLAKDRPPHELVRVVALASFLDHKRTRLEKVPAIDADETLRQALALEDTYFGRPLVRRAVRALGAYPPGTTVELSNRAPAIVTRANAGDPFRPQVQLLRGEMAGVHVELRDINSLEVRFELSVARAIAPPLFVRADIPIAAEEGKKTSRPPPARPMTPPPPRVSKVEEIASEILEPPPASRETDALKAQLMAFLDDPPPSATTTKPQSLPSPVNAVAPPPRLSGAYSIKPGALLEQALSKPPPAAAAYSTKPPVVTEATPKPPSAGRYSGQMPAVVAESTSKPPPASKAPFVATSRPPTSAGAYSSKPPEIQEKKPTSRPPPASVRSSKPPPGPVPVRVASEGVVAKQAGLDPLAGFVLSLVDGVATVDEIVDASGMSEADVKRIVDDLVARGLVAVRSV
jgi:putative nucleotidyltransferase with HDIG domain